MLHCDRARSAGRAQSGLLPFRPTARAATGTEKTLATQKELSDFLASVERRAFKQSVFSVRDDEAALDIVQDSMMKLAEKYAAKPAEELPLLFQRILQNTIRDHFRRQKVRSTWTTLLSNLGMGGEDDEGDPLETLEVEEHSNVSASPAEQLEQSQVMAVIEDAVKALPGRQREAFLLRYWEELDVSETAKAMGCSEGSVKTHCSRATHALAKVLRAKGITL
jgi:RNA polymerase sigma-70 factor (ECF subfamily)